MTTWLYLACRVKLSGSDLREAGLHIITEPVSWAAVAAFLIVRFGLELPPAVSGDSDRPCTESVLIFNANDCLWYRRLAQCMS